MSVIAKPSTGITAPTGSKTPTGSTSPDSRSLPWLFSPWLDLFAFGGSFAIAIGLLLVGASLGILWGDTPGWTWVATILLIDVAHVYATGFRVYFEPAELRRRPWLYGLTPLLAFVIGGAVYSESVPLFWSLLAYLAVFHFIRQQYGWVAMYRSRERDFDPTGWWIDATAIYLATIYPLVHWHAHLPRSFWWFAEGDFVPLPSLLAAILQPVYWIAMAAYAIRSVRRGIVAGRWNPGKDIVVATTAVCWYVGIISLNSDYAFTVTNVIIHGVPYMVLIAWVRWGRNAHSATDAQGAPADRDRRREPSSSWLITGRVASFVGIVWLLAYAEELLWDCGLWHRHPWLFGWFGGGQWDLGWWEWWWAPALAVPQITHYVLDGFLWRRSRTASG